MKISNPVNLIIFKDNKILLVKRSKLDVSEFDKWSIPGGGSELTESFEDTLSREIKEELGCEIKKFNYFSSYVFQFKDFVAKAVYFYGLIEGNIILNEESSEFQWFDVDELKNLDLAFNQNIVLEDFLEFIIK